MPLPLKLSALLAAWLFAPLLLVAADSPPAGTTATPAPAAAPTTATKPQPLPSLAKVEFPRLGVSMLAFDAPPTDANPWPLTLSASYGSVRVEISMHVKSMADFMTGVKDWGSRRSLKILLDKKISANERAVEFAGGSLGGEKMHVYGRGFLVNGKVLFAKATATEKQWAQGGDKLKACVDSFELMPAPGTAQPAGSTPAATVAKAEFPQNGFRIAVLDDPTDNTQAHGLLGTTFLTGAISNLHGTTVVLQVEPWTKTMAEYAAEIKKQTIAESIDEIRKGGLPFKIFIPQHIRSEKFPDPNTWVVETDTGYSLRCVLTKGRLFSAMVAQPLLSDPKWPEFADLVKECVDSLAVIEAPKVAPAK